MFLDAREAGVEAFEEVGMSPKGAVGVVGRRWSYHVIAAGAGAGAGAGVDETQVPLPTTVEMN